MTYGDYYLLTRMQAGDTISAPPFKMQIEKDGMCKRRFFVLVPTSSGLTYLSANPQPKFPTLGMRTQEENGYVAGCWHIVKHVVQAKLSRN